MAANPLGFVDFRGEAVPFVASPPYEVRPDVHPLRGPDASHLRPPPDMRDTEADLDALSRAAEHVRGIDGLPSLVGPALRALADVAARECPDRVHLDDPGVLALPGLGLRLRVDWSEARAALIDTSDATVANAVRNEARTWLARAPAALLLLDALALALAEDFAVVHVDANGVDRVAALHVCSPAGWSPAEKLGQGLAAVHVPVADSERLVAAMPELARMMVRRGPFVRHVWGLQRGTERLRLPTSRAPEGPWHYRVERQTLIPVPTAACAVFTIRTWLVPLDVVADDDARRLAIADSVASMSEAVLHYKGMGGARDELLALLRGTP